MNKNINFTFILFSIIFAKPLFAASILEQILFEIEYKNSLINGSKNKVEFNPKIECPKYVRLAQEIWKKNLNWVKDGQILQGEMEKPFTSDEILNMKNVNIHGVVGKVRGTDKILLGGYSYASAPDFPHNRNGCEHFFKEEVTIFEWQGNNCRRVKFDDDVNKTNYTQTYCENSTKIYINIDPNLSNSSNCYSGKDLVNCNK